METDLDPLLCGIAESEKGTLALRGIDLSGGVIGKEGMSALAVIMGCGKVPDLCMVTVSDCCINNEGLRTFAEAFRSRQSSKLVSLDLERNLIGL